MSIVSRYLKRTYSEPVSGSIREHLIQKDGIYSIFIVNLTYGMDETSNTEKDTKTTSESIREQLLIVLYNISIYNIMVCEIINQTVSVLSLPGPNLTSYPCKAGTVTLTTDWSGFSTIFIVKNRAPIFVFLGAFYFTLSEKGALFSKGFCFSD